MSPLSPLSPDPQQQTVIDHDRGALLVTGGPGTGKTTALAERFVALVEAGADPERLALVVRTAADRARLRALLFERLGRSLPNLNVLTAHALANHVLTRRYADLGYDEPPKVLTASEQHALVSELIASGDSSTTWTAYAGLRHLHGFADQVRNFLLRAQEALLSPEDIRERAKAKDLGGWLELADFYAEYLDVVGATGRLDFAGQLQQAAAAAAKDGAEPLFDHLMVDDYQDSTMAAESLLVGLAAGSLVVAADPDAHIFAFQGYTDAPLRRFTEVVPTATVLRLDTRYREAPIGSAWACDHPSDEAIAVARELRRLHAEGTPWGEMAVVLRRQGAAFEAMLRALDDAGVPRAASETWHTLTAEPAAKPYVLALRWLAAAEDAPMRDALIESLLTSELAGLTPAGARGLVRAAVRAGKPRATALNEIEGLNADESAALTTLRSLLADAEAVASRSAQDAFAILWRGLPHSARLVADAGTGDRRDLDAVLAFSRLIARAGGDGDISVHAFLDSLAEGDGPGLSSDGVARADAVHVMTAHAAAGHEFDTVIVAGAVEGDFPSLTRPERMFDLAVLDGPIPQAQRNRLRLEDERRLFKMVLARARTRVVLTAADMSATDAAVTGRSRFADEAGVEWVRVQPGPWEDCVSVAEASALWRHRLADLDASAGDRLAAIEGLLALGTDPARWWFQRDWTDPGREPREAFSTSFSRLNQLENCELAYALGQELGLGGRAGYHAWVGKVFHKLAEDCDNGLIERSHDALAAAAIDRWNPDEFPSFAVSEEYKRLVTEVMIPNWLDEFGAMPAAANEQGFSFEIAGATVRGFIDRISEMGSGGYRITDYKTGRPTDLTKAEGSLQLGIYWLSTEEDPGMAGFQPVRRAELSFVKGDVKGEYKVAPFQPHSRDVPAWLDGMRERIADNVERIRELWNAGEFEPSTVADCHFCEFKSLCSLFPEGQPVLEETGT